MSVRRLALNLVYLCPGIAGTNVPAEFRLLLVAVMRSCAPFGDNSCHLCSNIARRKCSKSLSVAFVVFAFVRAVWP